MVRSHSGRDTLKFSQAGLPPIYTGSTPAIAAPASRAALDCAAPDAHQPEATTR